MANQEQLEILKQGVEVWNKWRKKHNNIFIDLNHSNLRHAILNKANLQYADIREADLRDSDLRGVILFGADLRGTELHRANLQNSDLRETDLRDTDFRETNLRGANFHSATLIGADFNKANFDAADLSRATLGRTTITNVDLSKTNGLDTVGHQTPSDISIRTIQLSNGNIPEVFLRGCSLTDLDIEYAKLYQPNLSNTEINNVVYRIFDLRANKAIQISPLFISYSHADTQFVDKLGIYLTENGIRFWRDTHHATAGRLETQIDRAMRQNPLVLLVLSKNSTTSDWVEHEAHLARQLEKEIGRDVLCPIALDDSWKTAKWPARLMEQIKEYNILDFSNWKDDKAFKHVFNNMISGLDVFYKK